jgi:DNA-binding response OmpR family regulator
MSTRIAIIDDDEASRDALLLTLEDAGFQALAYEDGSTGLAGMRRDPPDLALIDVTLGGEVDGIELCRRMRADARLVTVPAIIVTTHDDSPEVTVGLGAGADDYLTRPWRRESLLARVNWVVGRTRSLACERARLEHGPITLFPARREAFVAGRPVRLTPTEYDILYTLVSRPCRVFSRHHLSRARHKDGLPCRKVDVHVFGLRRKLGEHGRLIRAVRGSGYRITEGGDVPGARRGLNPRHSAWEADDPVSQPLPSQGVTDLENGR